MGRRITFHVNSYNRLPLLKNLLHSFEVCNEYRDVEWIITDYGSVDGSRKFIKEYAAGSDFSVKAVISDEEDYFEKYRQKGLTIDSRWAKFRAVIGKFRSEARRLATGELMFDLSEDHQFIRRGNWVEEIMQIYQHRKEETGKDDISGIVSYGYARNRLIKPNNSMGSINDADGVPYFISSGKSYVDYSVMKKTTYDKVGEYLDPLNLVLGTREAGMWESGNDLIQSEAEYERRCKQLGLVRIFMKYPIAVSFPNNFVGNKDSNELMAPLWSLEDMKNRFSGLDRPVSSDELAGEKSPNIVDRGFEFLNQYLK